MWAIFSVFILKLDNVNSPIYLFGYHRRCNSVSEDSPQKGYTVLKKKMCVCEEQHWDCVYKMIQQGPVLLGHSEKK